MKIKNTKKLIMILLASFILLSVFVAFVPIVFKNNENNTKITVEAAVQDETYSSGSGTSIDPWIIKTKTQLNKLASNVNSGTWSMPGYKQYWKLGNDLDYDYGAYTPIGYYHPFYGHLDGGGYKISNAKITITQWMSSGAQVGVGIIGKLYASGGDAWVKNLFVSNLTVEITEGSSISFATLDVGGVVGFCNGGPTIENCQVDMWWNINGNFNGVAGFGGITSYESSGYKCLDINNCKVDTAYLCFNRKGSLSGELYIAGICYSYATITNCYAGMTGHALSSDANYITEEYDISKGSPYSDEIRCYSKVADSYSFDSISSSPGTSGTVWYFNSKYHKQPFLKQFMTWGKVEFTKNIEGGTITRALIEVPGSGIYLADSKLTSASLDIYGTTVTASANSGFTFTGWKRISNNEYQAQFTAASYTITYYDAYTHSNPESYTALDTITLSYPKRDGYEFEGWTGSNGTTPQKSVTIEGSTGDKEYTANWAPIKYTITYDYNGGSLPAGQTNRTTYNIETASFTLKNPTRAGYIFAGWTGSNGTTKQKTVTISKGSYGNKTYKANWTLQIYKIEYDLDGGARDQVYLGSYTVANTPFTLDYSPTKVGYEFIGWTGSNGTTAQKSITVASGTTGDLEYTANWERVKIHISFAKIEGAKLIVNGVEQEEFEAYVYYDSTIQTSFDGVNNIYSYTLQTMSGTNITVGYKVEDKEKWVSKFNLPKDNGVNSREEPTWEVDHEDIGGSKQFTITPTIELKEYEGELA